MARRRKQATDAANESAQIDDAVAPVRESQPQPSDKSSAIWKVRCRPTFHPHWRGGILFSKEWKVIDGDKIGEPYFTRILLDEHLECVKISERDVN